MSLEVEIKLRVRDPEEILARLVALGFALHHPRALERNAVFDTRDGALCGSGRLLRIREFAGETLLTYKGPGIPGPHKSREEIETGIAEAAAFERILNRLGYRSVFLYEKFRSEYRRPDGKGMAMLDETPIGDFLELEGDPDWIDSTALELGFTPTDYITESYGGLFAAYRRERPGSPPNMLFPGNRGRD